MKRQLRTISQMREADGRPLSVRELADIIGMSSAKVRTDIASGTLQAVKMPCASPDRFWFRIPYQEAQRYLSVLGFLRCSTRNVARLARVARAAQSC